jgi:uncharacterized phage protein (TIGR01671 family)
MPFLWFGAKTASNGEEISVLPITRMDIASITTLIQTGLISAHTERGGMTMREILFRGKRIDNGEWVEGSLLIDGEAHKPKKEENLSFSKHYIVPETDRDNIKTRFNDGAFYLNTIAYHVIPETVGQFTGLTDKYGKKIFEGDIVHYLYQPGEGYWNSDQNSVIEWDSIGFYMRGIFGTNKYACTHGFLSDIPIGRGEFFEVIGNIHDNPELLRGGNENE